MARVVWIPVCDWLFPQRRRRRAIRRTGPARRSLAPGLWAGPGSPAGAEEPGVVGPSSSTGGKCCGGLTGRLCRRECSAVATGSLHVRFPPRGARPAEEGGGWTAVLVLKSEVLQAHFLPSAPLGCPAVRLSAGPAPPSRGREVTIPLCSRTPRRSGPPSPLASLWPLLPRLFHALVPALKCVSHTGSPPW